MTRIPCPYCSQIVEASAFACSTCGGLLTIGSPVAIRQALASDPTLSLKDPDSVARLKEFVAQIDDSISTANRNKLEAQIQKERSEKESFLMQQQKIAAQQSAKQAARNDYLDSLSPFRKFLTVRKLPIGLVLVGLVVSALIIPGQLMNAQQANEEDRIRQQQRASAAAADEAAVLSAKEALPAIEARYCEIIFAAVDDPDFYPTIRQNEVVPREAPIAVLYLLPLVELNDEYDVLTRNLKGNQVSSLIIQDAPLADYKSVTVNLEDIVSQRRMCEAR
jgi:hypothetical protein